MQKDLHARDRRSNGHPIASAGLYRQRKSPPHEIRQRRLRHLLQGLSAVSFYACRSCSSDIAIINKRDNRIPHEIQTQPIDATHTLHHSDVVSRTSNHSPGFQAREHPEVCSKRALGLPYTRKFPVSMDLTITCCSRNLPSCPETAADRQAR